MAEASDNSALVAIGDKALARLEAINTAREQALADTRQLVRLSANAIRAVHRGEFDEADTLLAQACGKHAGLREFRATFPQIYWAGYVQDAQKEYAEARLVRTL